MFRSNLKKITPDLLRPNQLDYLKMRKLIRSTELLAEDELIQWQFNRLKSLVDFVWLNSEGYKKHWQNHGFHPGALHTLDDISLIPFITKDIIKNDLNGFSINKNKSRKLYSTGGSSGNPLSFYNSDKLRVQEEAFIHELWSKFYPNISRSTKRTIIRGEVIESGMEFLPHFGLKLSSRNLTKELAIKFVAAIDKYKTPILHVYPSSLYVLANLIQSHNLKAPKHKFEAIYLGSEPLLEYQKNRIKEVFQGDICYWYGSSEKVILAGNQRNNDNFCVVPQYGITELVDSKGKIIRDGSRGELVGTSLWCDDTPFIRYKTSDYARYKYRGTPVSTGGHKELLSIDGRQQEFAVSKSYSLLSMTYIAGNIHDETFNNIKQFRFFQHIPGKIVFNYVAYEGIAVNIEEVQSKLNYCFGKEYEVIVKQVDAIETQVNGKSKYIEQKLDIKEYL